MRPRTTLRAGVAGLATLTLLVACGDDDDASDKLCDAQTDLDSDVAKLKDLDITDTSVNDIKDILGNIGDDLQSMKDAGEDKLSPQLDAVSSALDSLGTSIDNLGDSTSLSDAASSIQTALGDVGDATSDLKTAADDDC